MEDDIKGQTTGWMSEASPFTDEETWIYIDLEEVYVIEAVVPYPREAQYVRIYVYERSEEFPTGMSGYIVELSEIEVFGCLKE